MYSNQSSFGIRFYLLLAIIILLYLLFSVLMRRLLKVNRKKFFSYNHVNERHKKIDWMIRITFTVFIVVGFIINMNREPMDMNWYLQPWFFLVIFIGVTGVARALMEWQYAKNRNDYKYTIFELLFIFVLFFVLYLTDFLWLV